MYTPKEPNIMKKLLLFACIGLNICFLYGQPLLDDQSVVPIPGIEHATAHPFPLSLNGTVTTPYQKIEPRACVGSGKLRLDSMLLGIYNTDILTIQNHWKFIYEYNSPGYNSLMLFHEWNHRKGRWTPNYKVTFMFNTNGFPMEISYYKHHPDDSLPMSDQWMPDDKYTYQYNQNNKLVESIQHSWSMNQMQWNLRSRVVIELDSADRPIEIEVFKRDLFMAQWVKVTMSSYVYNMTGLPVEIINHGWSNEHNIYLPTQRTLLVYDTTGLLLSETLQKYDTLAGVYMNHLMVSLEWDTYSRLIEEIQWVYNTSLPAWIPLTKKEFGWDQNNNLVSEAESAFQLYSMGWDPLWKKEFGFDASNNLSAIHHLDYNQTLQQWVLLNSDLRFHDNSWPMTDLLLPYMTTMNSPDGFRHKLDSIVGFDVDGMVWERRQVSSFYYSLHQTNHVSMHQPIQHKVFPNPAKNTVTFETPETVEHCEVGLFDLTGRQIIIREFNKKVSLSVEDLSPGVYIYRITSSSGQMLSGRLVIGL